MQRKDSCLQTIILPVSRHSDWRESLKRQINECEPGLLELDCRDWSLSYKDFMNILTLLEKFHLKINLIRADIPETIVSASSLGLQASLNIKQPQCSTSSITEDIAKKKESEPLTFHQGTLRSGEHLEADGDILLFGDVNPGAKVSAGGDVLIWGRLLGIAHAGKRGDINSKIVALQLRPLQLRIANKVARGPQEKPEEGLAEEALLESGQIIIKPARINSLRTA